MKESEFQSKLKQELRKRFPGCIVRKMDCNDAQGQPDLVIFWKNKWATLEVKRNANAKHRPNQDYWVEIMNGMSFSAFIFPENMEDVLNDLERSFEGPAYG